MKKVVLCMFLLLSLVATSTEKPKMLNLDGSYINEKNVKCEVFMVEEDSTLKELDIFKSNKYFSFSLREGYSYVIKFTSKKGKVKELYIPDAIAGDFMFNVDFSTGKSACLTYKKEKNDFSLDALSEKDLWVTVNH